MLTVIEETVYASTYDTALLTGVKNHRASEDMLAYTAFETVLAEIEETRSKEAEAKEPKKDHDEGGPSGTKSGAGDVENKSDVPGPASGGASGAGDSGDSGDAAKERAARKVRAHVRLLAEPASENALVEAIRSTPAGAFSAGGSEKVFTAIVFDAPSCGEAMSQPHLRQPPLRDAQLKKLVWAALRGRNPAGELKLKPRDQVVMFDGGTHGHERLFKGVFKDTSTPVSAADLKILRTTIITDEESLKERRRSARGVIKQGETMYTFTSGRLRLPLRRRAIFPGTNRGDSIGPVMLDPTSDTWTLSFKTKKLLFGKNRIPVGGRVDSESSVDEDEGSDSDEEADESGQEASKTKAAAKALVHKDETIEPVFYRARARKLFEELVHGQCWRSVISLLPSDGALARACVLKGLHFTGICFTETHAEELFDWLVKVTMQDMKEDPTVATSKVVKRSAAESSSSQTKGPQRKKPKAAAKRKVAKKQTADEEDDNEEDDASVADYASNDVDA